VLHAVFHRALIRADLIVAAVQQRLAPSVHALANLVIFDAGFQVGRLLGLDKLRLKGMDFFR